MKEEKKVEGTDNKQSAANLKMDIDLFALKNTKYWPSIKRYVARVSVKAEQILCASDPLTQPTDMARNQGIRLGLQQFEKYVEEMKDPESVIEEEE